LDIDGDGSARDSAAKVGHHNDGIALVLHNKSLRSALEKASLAGCRISFEARLARSSAADAVVIPDFGTFSRMSGASSSALWHTGPGNRGRLAGAPGGPTAISFGVGVVR
jgi:hypothetical protein